MVGEVGVKQGIASLGKLMGGSIFSKRVFLMLSVKLSLR